MKQNKKIKKKLLESFSLLKKSFLKGTKIVSTFEVVLFQKLGSI